MTPLRPEDFFSWPDYEAVRNVTRHRLADYIRTQRTVRFPSGVELIFDNRQTLWFRMQETIWMGRLFPKKDSLIELEAINRMLCAPGELEAHLSPLERASLPPEPDPWPEELALEIATKPAIVLKPDLLKGNSLTSAWDRGIRFRWSFSDSERALFSQFLVGVTFKINLQGVRESSEPLPLPVRRSLLGDWEAFQESIQGAQG